MKINELVLKFEEKKDVFSFTEKINLVENEKLIKILGRENIRNSNSSLIIQSMNNLPIYDVIQFKINVGDVGTFFINFEKDKVNETNRSEMLEKISSLKKDEVPTKETQAKKIADLFNIVKNYNTFYISYVPNGELKFSSDELSSALQNVELSFPILYLQKHEKIYQKEVQPGKLDFNFPKFSFEYLFTTIFAMLFSFGIFTGIFEIFNGQSIAAFLLVLTLIFFMVLSYSVYSTIYENNKELHSGMKFYIIIYIIIGLLLGLVLGYLISFFVLKQEVEEINKTMLLLIVILPSVVLGLAAVPLSKLIQLIVNKIKK